MEVSSYTTNMTYRNKLEGIFVVLMEFELHD